MGSAYRDGTEPGGVPKKSLDFSSEGLISWEKMALRKVTLGQSIFLTRTLPFDGFFFRREIARGSRIVGFVPAYGWLCAQIFE